MDNFESIYKRHLKFLEELTNGTGRAKDALGIERLAKIFLTVICLLLPVTIVQWLFGQRAKGAVEVYAVAKPLVLLATLACACGTTVSIWAAVLASVWLVDLFTVLVGVVLMTEFWSPPASKRRSLILLMFNFWELVLGFAVLYSWTGSVLHSDGSQLTGWLDLLYFSAVTSATIGYGDLVPVTDSGKRLVVIQVFASFVFITTVLAYFVGGLATPDSQNGPEA